MAKRICEIAVTGPAGSGKSVLLERVVQNPQIPGWRILRSSEIATPVIMGGLKDIMELAQSNPAAFYQIQRAIFVLQVSWRKELIEIARHAPEANCLILHDRGFMDQLLYITPAEFRRIRLEAGKTLYDTRDSYDAVLFLRSAASAGKELYTQENNPARRESAEDSLAQERPLLAAWTGHPHLHIIPSYPSLEKKLDRFRDAIAHVLSETEIERKFSVKPDPAILSGAAFQDSVASDIEQRYLKKDADDNRPRIRKEWQDDSISCRRTHKKRVNKTSTLERIEIEYSISPETYEHLATFQEADTLAIRKKRHYFVFGNQYFSLDVFLEPKKPFWLLEVELMCKDDPVELPPFLKIEKEVTEDSAYSNREISSKK
ncbi:MAG: AAA family ATPase [bacterium]|nr:AAA family ATPase [bacterium]